MPEPPRNFKVTAPPPSAQSRLEGQVVRALGSIGAATLASRVLGFVRDMVVALVFGAGPVTDAFFVAFRIPNILRRLLAEGALSTAVIPVFTDYFVNRPREESLRMLRGVFAAALLALGAATVLGVLGAPWILGVIAPGFAADPEKFALTVRLTRWLFPFITLVALWAMAGGLLNSLHRFGAPALGPVVLNVIVIAGCLWIAPHISPPVYGVAAAVMIGGAAQLLMQVPLLMKLGFRWRWVWRNPGAGQALRLLVPRIAGTAVYQADVFFVTILASLPVAGEGAVAAMYFANRLIQLPLALFATSSAQASLPALAEQAAVQDFKKFQETVAGVLRMVVFETIPAAVGLVVLARPIVQVCFQHGAFTAHSTLLTYRALGCMALGLLGYAASKILTSACYALHDTRTPVRLAFEALLINIALALALLQPLGVSGLALATAISSTLNSFRLLRHLERRLGMPVAVGLAGPALRVCAAALVMGGAAWIGWPLAQLVLPPSAALALVIVGSLVVYGAGCWLARVPQMMVLSQWFAARLTPRRLQVE